MIVRNIRPYRIHHTYASYLIVSVAVSMSVCIYACVPVYMSVYMPSGDINPGEQSPEGIYTDNIYRAILTG